MGKIGEKLHKAKFKMHKNAAKNGPARDSNNQAGKAVKEKVKEKKSKWL